MTLEMAIALGLAQASVAPAAPAPALPAVESDFEAWTADAREYAGRYGVPLAEALRRLQAQEASVAVTDQIQRAYRDRLAGLFIEHVPTWRIVVLLTGDAPVADRFETIAGGVVPVAFRTGAGASRDRILVAIEAHQADIRAALRHPPGMGVDPRSGKLVVIVRAEDLDDGDAGATAARLEAIAGVPVQVRTWADSDRDLAVEGGGRVAGIDPADGRRYVCTSGFVVTDGARTAITTAAHCPDTLSFVDRDKSATPLTMIGAWGARYQDVQIHLADRPLAPLLRADDADRPRAVASWRNRTGTRAGDFVCHRGERTGYSCSEVEFVDYAPPGDLCAGPCPALWVAVKGPRCKSGDSGGPVFLGTIAFGTTKGGSYTGDGACKLYYYMSTDYLPPGWTLLHR